MARIDIDRVSKVYPDGTRAVADVDLTVEDGAFMVLVGPSGCGKTTLLRMIAGLESIGGGEIRIGGDVVNDVPPSRRDIAMVFQSYALYPHMTVYDNMAFGLRRRVRAKDEVDAEVQRAARVLGLTDQLHKKPRALSGGQRQRVAMGRAIVRRPRAFLMDEPLSNLDAKLRGHMRAEIARLQRDLAATTVYVTHDQVEAMTLGDVVAVMNHGRIQQLGAPQTLFERPANLFVAAFMGSPTINLVEATLTTEGDRTVAAVGSQRLRLPESAVARRPALRRYLGRTVALGIRPDDVTDVVDQAGPDACHLDVVVELRELLGRATHLHFVVDARPIVSEDTREAGAGPDEIERGASTSRLIATVAAGTRAHEGDRVRLAVDPAALLFFDVETGLAIDGYEQAARKPATRLDRVAVRRDRDVERVADGFTFLEGPRWHAGRLYFSDFYTRRVHTVKPGGQVSEVCAVPGRPSGLGFTPDGDLLIVSMADRRLLRLDGTNLVQVADLSDLAPADLNDLVVDAAGRAYIGNFGSNVDEEPIRATQMLRVDPDGTAAVAAEDLIFPNGAAITPDGGMLLVAESFAFRITAFDVGADGVLSGRREWARFGSATAADLAAVLAARLVVPDGICLDAEGALWVGDATGSGALRVVEGGQVVDAVDTGDLAVFAVALGGSDRRTLYMCAGPPLGQIDPATERRGVLLACRVDVPGAGLP